MNRRQFLSGVGLTTLGIRVGGVASAAPPKELPGGPHPRVGTGVRLPATYEGTSRLNYQATDMYGAPLEPREINLPAQVSLNEPLSFGGLTESNPFNFLIATGNPENEGSPTVDEGKITLLSALGTYTPDTGREVLLQYWEVAHDETTGELQGELTNTHSSEASAVNLLWVANAGLVGGPGPTISWPYEGAMMQGTITDDAIGVVVHGSAFALYGGIVEFSVEIQGQRTQ